MRHIPGILLALALLVLETLFMVLLADTQLLPVKLLIVVGVVLLMMAAWVIFLTWEPARTWRLFGGVVFTLVVMGLIGFCSSYLIRGVDTLDQITAVTVEVAHVGVYVRNTDEAQSINQAQDYVFGILTEQDRENTDKALEQLEKELGTPLTIREYSGLAELVDGLLTGETCQAIVLNSAFVGVLEDMEGYENAGEQLREVHVQQVETVIEHVVEQKQQEEKEDAQPEEEAEEDHTFSVYLSGIDSRGGLIAKSRSDVNIIATVNTQTRQILLVSTPRDFYVPLPISNGTPDKLTHAGIYGVDCSIGTLEMLYNTEIDYYFRVNFSGFVRIIDTLGGVTVDSEVSFSRDGYSFYKGENWLDGAAALTFARERKNLAGGDRQRGENQMDLIEAVIDKVKSPALLANYNEILREVSDSFEASIPYDLVAELVRMQLDDGGDWNIVSYSVDGTGASRKPYSLSTNAYVMIPNQEMVDHAAALMQQVRDGVILEKEDEE